MLRRCCCDLPTIAIVNSWTSATRGQGAGWRAAWPAIGQALRGLPVRWTTAIDLQINLTNIAGVAQDFAARAPALRLVAGGPVVPPRIGYVLSRSVRIEDAAPPDFASAPTAWPNLERIVETSAPRLSYASGGDPASYSRDLFPNFPLDPGTARPGERAVIWFGAAPCSSGPCDAWPFAASPLDPPMVSGPGLTSPRAGLPSEAAIVRSYGRGLVTLWPLNGAAAGSGIDGAIGRTLGTTQAGHATRLAAATGGEISHDWGDFANIPKLIEKLKQIVETVLAR